ncbi:MAG TPA: FAD-dependent oxidoreductase, partial [Geobacteraceae bacterium]
APALLEPAFSLKTSSRLFFAGQISGVEGYVESAASGFLAGINAARSVAGGEPVVPPATTALGALVHHITTTSPGGFQPMNVNYGLFPELPGKVKKKERRQRLAERALADLGAWLETV